MNDRLDKLKDIKIENFIWIIYIGIIILSWYANSKEKNFILFNDEKSRQEYQNLTYASFIGSALVLVSGIIFLTIAILDEEIDVELAFN